MKNKRVKKTYNVKEYLCEACRHQFKTSRPEKIETCNKCGGTLKIIGRYKSSKPPMGSPGRGQPWLTSELFMEEIGGEKMKEEKRYFKIKCRMHQLTLTELRTRLAGTPTKHVLAVWDKGGINP